MNNVDLSIILFTVIISLSGLIINYLKRGNKSQVLFSDDGNTLLFFRLGIPISLFVSVAIYFIDIGFFVSFLGIKSLGYLMIISGLLIRWLAVYQLGNAFQVSVSIINNQQLIDHGLYSKIRHPSYTGLLLYYLGLGLLMQNFLCIILLSLVPLLIVLLRIKKEEAVLNAYFKEEYALYISKTKKLIPFIF